VKELYCAHHQIERDGRLMDGVFLHVFLDQTPPENLSLSINFYQEQMKRNPVAIPCGEC
jgi:hypothetical protein